MKPTKGQVLYSLIWLQLCTVCLVFCIFLALMHAANGKLSFWDIAMILVVLAGGATYANDVANDICQSKEKS